MKIWKGTTTAPGAIPGPAGRGPAWQTTSWASAGIVVDGDVLDGHVVLLEPLAHLAGDHHAAAHPGIAGDDHLPDVPAVELWHDDQRSARGLAG